MARRLRYVPNGGGVVEVTARVFQSRFLLTPSAKLDDRIRGAIGRALSRPPGVKVHAFVVLSNHLHILLSVLSAYELSRFMCELQSRISWEASRAHGWNGTVFPDRYSSIPVADDAAQIERLRYIFSHGVKEGLVAHPFDWPGVASVHALQQQQPLRGSWLHRTALSQARARNAHVDERDFTYSYEIPLAKIPAWQSLSDDEYRRSCLEIVEDIADAWSAENERLGRSPVGAATILNQDPFAAPAKISRSPAPLVHATTAAVRKAFVEGYRAFVAAFREAAVRLRDAALAAFEFPAQSQLPPVCLRAGAASGRLESNSAKRALGP
jgi:REP element-mobilizing transposase RayT